MTGLYQSSQTLKLHSCAALWTAALLAAPSLQAQQPGVYFSVGSGFAQGDDTSVTLQTPAAPPGATGFCTLIPPTRPPAATASRLSLRACFR